MPFVHQNMLAPALLAVLAGAAPAPQASSTQGADSPYSPTGAAAASQYSVASSQYSSILGAVTPTPASSGNAAPTVFGPDSQVEASAQTPSQAAPPVRSSQVSGITSHGPYAGSATTTGAPQSGPAALSIPALPPNPTATYYNANGDLTQEEPAPYVPAGMSVFLMRLCRGLRLH